ncbi:MAG: hypothetical protein JO263_11710, partial [Candidatus Eremiobacteraeota bacterium]|nr:hypothetical protein [Candidatus Eremiobacteraeota bacterium]
MSSSLPVWFTARFLWALAAIALLLACSPGAAFFVPLAIALAAVLLVATLADALIGPRAAEIIVKRALPEHFALGVAASLSYAVENH